MLLLEKAHARTDLVRNAAARELDLQLERLMVGAVEDRDLVERSPFVTQLEDALRHELGLLARRPRRRRPRPGRRTAARAGASSRSGARSARWTRPRGGGSRASSGSSSRGGTRAVPRMPVRKSEQRLEVGPAEGVDGLRVVADHHDVRLFDVLDDHVHEVGLQAVHVLVLVHEDVPEARAEGPADLGALEHEPLPVQEEVVVVHPVREDLALEVPVDDRRGSRRAAAGSAGAPPRSTSSSFRPVFTQRDTIARRRSPFGKRRSVTGIADVRRRGLEEVLRVLRVEDREVRLDSRGARRAGAEGARPTE